MTADGFKAAVNPKLDGTRNLRESLRHQAMDFFVMLSSCASVLAPPSQANYAAGNACLDALAQSVDQSHTPYISINLPIVEDSEVILGHQDRLRSLIRRGCIQIKMDRLLSVIGYAMNEQISRTDIKQIVIGFDRASISSEPGLASFLFKNSMFSHLPYDTEESQVQTGAQETKSISELIAAQSDMEGVRSIIANSVAKKICGLVALEDSEIDFESSMTDFGLDSLVAIEMKNWLARTFEAAMQTSEILDAANISTLARIVAERSILVKSLQQSNSSDTQEQIPQQTNSEREPVLTNGHVAQPKQTSQETDTKCKPIFTNGHATQPELPQLPLPELEASLDLYKTSVKAFCTEEEFERVSNAVREFSVAGSLGQQLQQRLATRAGDRKVDNWQFSLYNDHVYLRCRAPVNPFQHFFGSFTASGQQHSQAERAAVICIAARQFKRLVDRDLVKPDTLNEQPLCMSSLKWLFIATRKPGIGIDVAEQSPENSHIVVLRHGHVFRVELRDGEKDTSFAKLHNIFQEILDTSGQQLSSVATLTADDRDNWAKVRRH